jgi:hypothetical protein
METWALGMLVGLMLSAMVLLIWRLEKCHSSIANMASNLHLSLKQDIENVSTETSDSFIDEIREELLGIVGSTIETMRPPNIADHLGGILNQFAQMKMMKMMQKEGFMGQTPPIAIGEMNNNPRGDEGAWQGEEPEPVK